MPFGRKIMGKGIFKHLVTPACIAALTAFICQPLYLASDGECDYILMLLLIGIPFGIGKMTVWIMPTRSSSIAGAAGILAFDILVGGMIGIFVLAFKLASGIWYLIFNLAVSTVYQKRISK